MKYQKLLVGIINYFRYNSRFIVIAVIVTFIILDNSYAQAIKPGDDRATSHDLSNLQRSKPRQAEALPVSNNEELTNDRNMAELTLSIAVIGFLQLLVFGYQSYKLQQTVIDTELAIGAAQRSATAAENAVKNSDEMLTHSQNVAQRQLRAYVGVNAANYKLQINSDGSANIGVGLELKNFGQTPAYSCRTMAALQPTPFPARHFPKLDMEENGHVLFPAMNTYISLGVLMQPAEFMDFLNQKICYTIILNADYNDTFNVYRQTIVHYLLHIRSPNMQIATHEGTLTFQSGTAD